MQTARPAIISEHGGKPVARPRCTTTSRSTGDYRHDDARRKNNPPVGTRSTTTCSTNSPAASPSPSSPANTGGLP